MGEGEALATVMGEGEALATVAGGGEALATVMEGERADFFLFVCWFGKFVVPLRCKYFNH
jgi:hypothetical protein